MQYYDWLISTNQDGAAGLLLQQQQDYTGAISLYMKAGLPARAAKLAFSRSVSQCYNIVKVTLVHYL